MKKFKKSKGISVSGICEWGGTLADDGTSYYYQISSDRHFAGVSDTFIANAVHGADVESDTYDEKVGANIADDVYKRVTTGFVIDNLEDIKGWWTMSKYDTECISTTYIPFGHQMCKNADDDGLTEVCAIHIEYHKVDYEEHAIHVDNFPGALHSPKNTK